MDDIHIDGSTATIITDRAIPPGDSGVARSTIKLVLYCLRGLGAPGATIKVDRRVILDRTQLGETAVKKAIRVLVGAGILTQTQRPAEGRPSQYMMSYAKLMDWLDEADREAVELYSTPSQRGRVAPASSSQQGRVAPASKSTGARGTGTGARRASTGARSAGAYKEETALPALPAAAEKTHQLPTLETRLENAAAAGVSIMNQETWERLGKRAGLTREMSTLAGQTLGKLGVESCEVGRRAIERLAERLKSPKSVTNAVGLLRSIITQDGGPEDSVESLRRARVESSKRARVAQDLESCDGDRLELIRQATTVVAQGMGHIEKGEEIRLGSSDAVFGYLARYNKEIMIQAATMVPMGVAS